MAALRPDTAGDLAAIVATAAADGRRLELRGGGSKAAIGAPRPAAHIVEMSGFGRIIDYDPAELVLTVGAGTPLCEIEALVEGEGQRLAFEPFDHGPILGGVAGAATIGGIVAGGVDGSRRVSAGGVRDHLLGFAGVSGRGERFIAGAKVVKNVTGYDLPKLLCGSWGRLAALTEVTLKVLPRPRETATRFFPAATPEAALRIMTVAMASRAGVAAAAYCPRRGMAAARIEGFAPSVKARLALLDGLFETVEAASESQAAAFWNDVRTLAPLASSPVLWRVSLATTRLPALLAAVEAGTDHMVDWAGGLVWLASDRPAGTIRAAAAAAGGHAMLVRGDPALRAATPVFQPRPPALAALEARVRHAFDPAGVFETGRFGDTADAH